MLNVGRTIVGSMRAKNALIRSLSTTPQSETVDYLILGGGSAGSVLSNRISTNTTDKVMVMDAGCDENELHHSWQVRNPFDSTEAEMKAGEERSDSNTLSK